MKELEEFAAWVELKSRQKNLEDKDILVTGDFNIESPNMLEALMAKGLRTSAGLKK
jgi:hypothetical protein